MDGLGACDDLRRVQAGLRRDRQRQHHLSRDPPGDRRDHERGCPGHQRACAAPTARGDQRQRKRHRGRDDHEWIRLGVDADDRPDQQRQRDQDEPADVGGAPLEPDHERPKQRQAEPGRSVLRGRQLQTQRRRRCADQEDGGQPGRPAVRPPATPTTPRARLPPAPSRTAPPPRSAGAPEAISCPGRTAASRTSRTRPAPRWRVPARRRTARRSRAPRRRPRPGSWPGARRPAGSQAGSDRSRRAAVRPTTPSAVTLPTRRSPAPGPRAVAVSDPAWSRSGVPVRAPAVVTTYVARNWRAPARAEMTTRSARRAARACRWHTAAPGRESRGRARSTASRSLYPARV